MLGDTSIDRDKERGASVRNHTWAAPKRKISAAKLSAAWVVESHDTCADGNVHLRLPYVVSQVRDILNMLPRYMSFRMQRTRKDNGRPLLSSIDARTFREFERDPVVWGRLSLTQAMCNGNDALGGFDKTCGNALPCPYVIPLHGLRGPGNARRPWVTRVRDADGGLSSSFAIELDKVRVELIPVRGSQTVPPGGYPEEVNP